MEERKNKPTPYQIEKVEILARARDIERKNHAEKDLVIRALEFMDHQLWVKGALITIKDAKKRHQELADSLEKEIAKSGICRLCSGNGSITSKSTRPISQSENKCSTCNGTGWKI